MKSAHYILVLNDRLAWDSSKKIISHVCNACLLPEPQPESHGKPAK